MPTKKGLARFSGDNIPYELPNDWLWVALKDIAPPDSTSVKPSDGPLRTINYLGLEGVEKGQWQDIRPREINSNEVKSNCIQFDNRHILYSKLRPYLNKVVVPEKPGLGSTEWVPLCPASKVIIREYIAWFLRSPWFVNYASSKQNTSGARMPRIRMQSLWSAPVPLPCQDDPEKSLFIQSSIVTRIESLLSEIKEARKLLNKLRRDAERVMDTALQEIFCLPQMDWLHTKLGSLLEKISTGTTPPSKEEKYYNGDIQWFTPGDLGETKLLVKSKRTLTRQAIKERKAKLFKKGTFLFVGIGATLGKVGVTGVECSANQQITGLEFNNRVNVDYGYYWFKANIENIRKHSGQATLPILNQAGLKNLNFYYPENLRAQKLIAQHLDHIDFQSKEAKEIIRKNILLLNQLEQSILERAFRGEL